MLVTLLAVIRLIFFPEGVMTENRVVTVFLKNLQKLYKVLSFETFNGFIDFLPGLLPTYLLVEI